MKSIMLIFVLSVIVSTHIQASGWGYKHNRIAISADGNNQADNLHFWPRADPDDWGQHLLPWPSSLS
ncbi:hypothetical protein RS130_02375 [Paraglaciecola aquimarina]|uniref:Uncharacterized protein n=1 Tax=Paraglaciecola aquimarina TaxID=1235557 RepID=A0ABU3SSD0_9ALTE|nr:hypothetical protein [Paraglaciecola aquimarina]MDU0352921.1 hypothetical protein [Paraglaciecola aquimarina]